MFNFILSGSKIDILNSNSIAFFKCVWVSRLMSLRSAGGLFREVNVLSAQRSVVIMRWNSKERGSVVEVHISNGCHVIATQFAYRNRFNLVPLAPVLERKSNVTKVTVFMQTGSETRRRTQVSPLRVRPSVLQSPRCFARKTCVWPWTLRSFFEMSLLSFRNDVHFHLCGSIKIQNLRYYAKTNSQELHPRMNCQHNNCYDNSHDRRQTLV